MLDNLFAPIKINTLELKNRAVMPAMGTGYAGMDGKVTDRLINYLERRAMGGAGLIITEICAIDPLGKGMATEVGIWNDEFIPGLSALAKAIQKHGAKAAVQLHHAGRETMKAITGSDPEAPSPLPSPILNQLCVEMSKDRIVQIIEAYAQAALRAKEAGFDAVELHGAHGYLIGQFLSPFSNVRNDEYGGSDENRARFALEVIAAVRKKVGRDFPVIIRVSSDELISGGYDLQFMEWLAPQLAKAGVDAIHASVAVYSTPGNLSIASMDTETGFNLFRARAIKSVVDIPVIGVGRIHDPVLADEALARGDADMIAFGRQHLADPDFINKSRSGRLADIRMCLACNQGCIDRLTYEMKSVTCTINPECGKEAKFIDIKSDKPRKVMIIGAGAAGLTAGMYAAKRGHKVTIHERCSEPGGQIKSAGQPPHKQALTNWLEWAKRQVIAKGIELHCNSEVTADVIAREKPDAIILSTGSNPSIPDIPGIKNKNVVDARDLLEGKVELKGNAVVLGAGFVGMETADYLIARGISVTILEMKTLAPVGKHIAHGWWLHKRLKKSGGSLILGATVRRIEDDNVFYTVGNESKLITPADMIVNAFGARPELQLEAKLKSSDIPYIIIGDAQGARTILEAIHEGASAGRDI